LINSNPGVLLIKGGPGTGKTVVALHRVEYLLRLSIQSSFAPFQNK
jgi:DNA helicase IV